MKFTLLFLICCLPGQAISDFLDCPCEVVKVLEGDTVHILDRLKAKHRIRLYGIDAPEPKQVFGEKSGKNLSDLVAGKKFEVEFSKRDRYGRIIGKLLKNGRDINLIQVKQGYAWHDRYQQKDQSEIDRILYSSAEIKAREGTTGLWAYPAIPPWEFRRKTN